MRTRGRVYIVGAGPGDPKLLTIRALEVLQGADVVIYDRLIGQAILKMVSPKAARRYAGKEPGAGDSTQDFINELMAREARAGKTVVRLKGGDPFIFSRGGEEAEFLRSRGVEFEVVPGVTSATGVPAYAGIPLTWRGISSSITILTGHQIRSGAKSLDWSKIAGASDTMILLMGATKIREIALALLEGGLPSETPVAAIRWGTTERQTTLLLTLSEAASRYHRQVRPPNVVVIGRVVLLASIGAWYQDARRTTPGYRALLSRETDEVTMT